MFPVCNFDDVIVFIHNKLKFAMAAVTMAVQLCSSFLTLVTNKKLAIQCKANS